jgi:hypothetical protein
MRVFRYCLFLFVVLAAPLAFTQCVDHDSVTAFDVPTSFVGGTYPSGQVTVHKSACIPDHDVLVEFGFYVQVICLDHTANGNCGAPVGKNTVGLTVNTQATYTDFTRLWYADATYQNDPGISKNVTVLAPQTCVSLSKNELNANNIDTITGTVQVIPTLPFDAFSVDLTQTPTLLNMPSGNSVTIPAGAGSKTFAITAGGTGSTTITTVVKPLCSVPVNAVDGGDDGDLVCPPGNCAFSSRPINLTNGNVWIDQRDFTLPGLGSGINVARTWNSRFRSNIPSSGFYTTFGKGWMSIFDSRLDSLTGGGKKYWLENGSSWIFNYDSINQGYILASPADEHATLTYSSSTTQFTLTLLDGSKKIFNSAGRIIALVDLNGN